MNLITVMTFLIAYAIGFLACIIALSGFRPVWRISFWKRKDKKSPIKDNLLAYPGMTLINQFDDKFLNSLPYVLFLLFWPTISFFIYFALMKSLLNDVAILSFVIFMLVTTGIGCMLLRKRFRLLRDLRLGLDAERVTGEELNQLMRHGFYVFHDLQAGNFNIDHIAIGSNGVFAIETKYRAKMAGKGQDGAKVSLQDKTLKFPNGLDKDSIPQAENQAKWLADFLKKSVGKEIPVQAVLALPGWFIEGGLNDTTALIINPKAAVKIFPNKKNILDDQTIQQIAYQVEQKCRTVTPFDPY